MENWSKVEFIFAKDLNITPIELDKMEFYRVEYMIMNYEEHIKKEEERNKSQQKEGEMSFSKNKQNMPHFKPPTMHMPNIKPPKLNF